MITRVALLPKLQPGCQGGQHPVVLEKRANKRLNKPRVLKSVLLRDEKFSKFAR